MLSTREFEVATWNIAAINNNPFEYWITHSDPIYRKLMDDVESFIEEPKERDVPVEAVFKPEMYQELRELMAQEEGWEAHLDALDKVWHDDLKGRPIVSGFLKDKSIGSKRLASMPDRVTNTIGCVVKGQPATLCRPTVINMSEGDMSSMGSWWGLWKDFMFRTEVCVIQKGATKTTRIPQMLEPIKQSKYPAITPEEEAMSLPLQTVCCAIFDAIMVNMLNMLAPGVWGPLKDELCDKLAKNKQARTIAILEESYSGAGLVFLQEVAASFVQEAARASKLSSCFTVASPANLDGKRDQNSMVLLNRLLFEPSYEEVTDKITSTLAAGTAQDGDIFAATVRSLSGEEFLVVSFHGDTNGLMTIPVVKAAHALHQKSYAGHRIIFGLDANAHTTDNAGKQLSAADFVAFYSELGLKSGFGDDPAQAGPTTYAARTYLQPQLNKACKSSEVGKKGDIHPKDFILFSTSLHEAVAGMSAKDNTGKRNFVKDAMMPTIDFPSDHALINCVLKDKLALPTITVVAIYRPGSNFKPAAVQVPYEQGDTVNVLIQRILDHTGVQSLTKNFKLVQEVDISVAHSGKTLDGEVTTLGGDTTYYLMHSAQAPCL